jgi:hypothetical protein
VLPDNEIETTGTEPDTRTVECSGTELPNNSVSNFVESCPGFNDTVAVANTTPFVSVACTVTVAAEPFGFRTANP